MKDFGNGWLGWVILAFAEIGMFSGAMALHQHGYLAWYLVPVSLFVLPVLAMVIGAFSLETAESDGENPFQ